jgi:DNA-binding HxlR family transcriptional regulator
MIVKCGGGAIAVPGKDGLDPKTVETVLSSLKKGDKSFDQLLVETGLSMVTLAEVLRSMTSEDVVIRGKNKKGVIFQYED